MRYVLKKRCLQKVARFYHNVSKKYKHTYSEELLHHNIDNAINSVFQIEHTILRREPTIKRWEGYYMAHAGKWYFAYTIEGEKIVVHDACHAQNMHEEEEKE